MPSRSFRTIQALRNPQSSGITQVLPSALLKTTNPWSCRPLCIQGRGGATPNLEHASGQRSMTAMFPSSWRARLVSVSLVLTVAIGGRRSLRMPARMIPLTVVCGVIDVLANVLYLLAVQQGPLSLVVTLSSLYPASTVLLTRVVLAGRLNSWQLSGVGCAFAAIVLIVSGG
jgi:drug/metabolite transporter (DMT)-like permease